MYLKRLEISREFSTFALAGVSSRPGTYLPAAEITARRVPALASMCLGTCTYKIIVYTVLLHMWYHYTYDIKYRPAQRYQFTQAVEGRTKCLGNWPIFPRAADIRRAAGDTFDVISVVTEKTMQVFRPVSGVP